MTVVADAGYRALTSKELFSMTLKAGFVLGVFRHIRKGLIAFPDFVPILRRKLMARLTG